ncbi:MAG: hypothetical protein HY075_10660 [Deltaproteobacteria bacterium]|nr:hypothetical protein [Deltaproteobacteria bacterium]
MQRIRQAVTAALVLGVLGVFGGGCTRYAYTRVFLHGEVEDEDGRPVPFAVVRVGEMESISDDNGHYRFLYLASCLRGSAGVQGVQTPDLEGYAPGFKPAIVGYHLDTIEVVGGGTCPADTDKYLRLSLVRAPKE